MALDHAAVVAALRGIDGIADVALTADDPFAPGALRISLRPGADEAAVAAEADRLLRTRFGVGMGTRSREVQGEAPRLRAVAGDAGRDRWAVESVVVRPEDLGARATVTLTTGERRVEGTAVTDRTSSGIQRGIARATGDALAEAAREVQPLRIDVEAVASPTVGDSPVVVVRLILTTEAGLERITGVATVDDDLRAAVVRAVLDAGRRRLGLLDESR